MSLPYDRPSDPAKRHSAALTDGPDRAGARAMLKAVGFTDEDLARPLVGVASEWIETMPCNLNQRDLAAAVKEGIRAAGGTPIEFNTVSVSDGVTMGTEGMKASLISREVVADFDRAGRAGTPVRRPRVPVRVRQDGAGCGHRGRTPRHPDRDPVQRHHPARPVPGQGPRHRVRVRGDRRVRGGEDRRERALRHRVARMPGCRRLRRPVHRQHHEHGHGGDGPLPRRAQRDPGARPSEAGCRPEDR